LPFADNPEPAIDAFLYICFLQIENVDISQSGIALEDKYIPYNRESCSRKLFILQFIQFFFIKGSLIGLCPFCFKLLKRISRNNILGNSPENNLFEIDNIF